MKLGEYLKELESKARISTSHMRGIEDHRRKVKALDSILSAFANSIAFGYDLDRSIDPPPIQRDMAVLNQHEITWDSVVFDGGYAWSTVPKFLRIVIFPDGLLPMVAELTHVPDEARPIGAATTTHVDIGGERYWYSIVYQLEFLRATFEDFHYAALISSWYYSRIDWDHVDIEDSCDE